ALGLGAVAPSPQIEAAQRGGGRPTGGREQVVRALDEDIHRRAPSAAPPGTRRQRGRVAAPPKAPPWRPPARESPPPSPGSSRTRRTAAAIASGSRGGTSRPSRPSLTSRGIPPTFVLTTQSPQAMASSSTTGALSTFAVFRKMSPRSR